MAKTLNVLAEYQRSSNDSNNKVFTIKIYEIKLATSKSYRYKYFHFEIIARKVSISYLRNAF